MIVALEESGAESYVAEPRRGHRNWSGKEEVQASVEANREPVGSARGRELGVLRTEKAERSMAHMYVTGGLRRVYLRGHANIRKRLLVHACGYNLGMLMRALTGIGTLRTLQGQGRSPSELVFPPIFALKTAIWRVLDRFLRVWCGIRSIRSSSVLSLA